MDMEQTMPACGCRYCDAVPHQPVQPQSNDNKKKKNKKKKKKKKNKKKKNNIPARLLWATSTAPALVRPEPAPVNCLTDCPVKVALYVEAGNAAVSSAPSNRAASPRE